MRPFKKLQVFVKFDPKNVITLYQTPYSPDLSPPDHFLFPKLKIKLIALYFGDVAEIQEAVTDELKKVQKRTFWQLFRKCSTAQKPVYKPIKLFLKRKGIRFPHVSSIFKKLSQKRLDRTFYEQRFIRQDSSANFMPSCDPK